MKKRDGFTHKYFEEEMEKIALPTSTYKINQSVVENQMQLLQMLAFRQLACNRLRLLSLLRQ